MQPDPDEPGVGRRTQPGNRGVYALILILSALAVVLVLALSGSGGADAAVSPPAPGAILAG